MQWPVESNSCDVRINNPNGQPQQCFRLAVGHLKTNQFFNGDLSVMEKSQEISARGHSARFQV